MYNHPQSSKLQRAIRDANPRPVNTSTAAGSAPARDVCTTQLLPQVASLLSTWLQNNNHSARAFTEAPGAAKTPEPLGAYRRKLCDNYIAGSCTFSTTCRYAHGEAELGTRNWHFKSSLCKGLRSGTCTKGRKCFFAHSEAELAEFGHGAASTDFASKGWNGASAAATTTDQQRQERRNGWWEGAKTEARSADAGWWEGGKKEPAPEQHVWHEGGRGEQWVQPAEWGDTAKKDHMGENQGWKEDKRVCSWTEDAGWSKTDKQESTTEDARWKERKSSDSWAASTTWVDNTTKHSAAEESGWRDAARNAWSEDTNWKEDAAVQSSKEESSWKEDAVKESWSENRGGREREGSGHAAGDNPSWNNEAWKDAAWKEDACAVGNEDSKWEQSTRAEPCNEDPSWKETPPSLRPEAQPETLEPRVQPQELAEESTPSLLSLLEEDLAAITGGRDPQLEETSLLSQLEEAMPETIGSNAMNETGLDPDGGLGGLSQGKTAKSTGGKKTRSIPAVPKVKPLPPGWVESWSVEYGVPFFWNEETETAAWERPEI